MPARILTVLCLIPILSPMAFSAEPIAPIETWSGKVSDKSLEKLAPKSGSVNDPVTWKTLWSAWRPNEALPKVDFSKEMILIGTVPGPNFVLMRPTLDAGDVRFLVGGTKIGGPGFGYKLLKINRAKVKSVNGIALAEEKPVPEDSVAVTVIGTLQTGIVALGGETTGTTITANNITWELDFGKNAQLRKRAPMLNGKKVRVQGRLEKRKGVEINERWIIHVTTLEAVGEGAVRGIDDPPIDPA